MIGYQRVMTLEVWAKESRSFKAGKSEFQGRKVRVSGKETPGLGYVFRKDESKECECKIISHYVSSRHR